MIITLKSNNILEIYIERGFIKKDIKYVILTFCNVDSEFLYSNFIKKDTITRITKLCTDGSTNYQRKKEICL